MKLVKVEMKKKKLEGDIIRLIQQFEEKTKYKVKDIYFYKPDMNVDILIGIKLI